VRAQRPRTAKTRYGHKDARQAWAWRAESRNDQEAAAAGVEDDEADVDEDDEDEDDEVEDDVEESDDEVDDVESAFLASEPFDFSVLTPPERESLR
jgi:hypothetical protein